MERKRNASAIKLVVPPGRAARTGSPDQTSAIITKAPPIQNTQGDPGTWFQKNTDLSLDLALVPASKLTPSTTCQHSTSDLERIIQDDHDILINYIPGKPSVDPPCPGAPWEKQTLLPNDATTHTIQWTANTIPWRIGQESPNGGLFANGTTASTESYRKYSSVPSILAYFAGGSYQDAPPESKLVTLFLKDFPDRGPSNMAKQIYMHAITSEKLHHYTDKIDHYLNAARSSMQIYREPVISSLKRHTIKFFLDMHLGSDNHPSFAEAYFTEFVNVCGFISNPHIDLSPVLEKSHHLASKVDAYIKECLARVMQEKDVTSFIYHWVSAGMPPETLLTELLHNVIAFVQFVNLSYQAIIDSLWLTESDTPGLPPSTIPYNILPGIQPINFFDKIKEAATAEDRLNVVRELFRLFTPNGAALSRVDIPSTTSTSTSTCSFLYQNRFLFRPVMIHNQEISANPNHNLDEATKKQIAFFTYNPDLYSDFNTSVLDCQGLAEKEPMQNLDLSSQFTFSELDNNPEWNDGTMIQRQNPKVQAVFEKPIYSPFGLAHRRCAGEMFVYMVTEKLLLCLASMKYEWRGGEMNGNCDMENPDLSLYEPIAPRTAPRDCLYVKR